MTSLRTPATIALSVGALGWGLAAATKGTSATKATHAMKVRVLAAPTTLVYTATSVKTGLEGQCVANLSSDGEREIHLISTQ